MVRKEARRQKIRRKIRKKLSGTKERPRLSVYRSNSEIYVQLIDDTQGHTLLAASSRDMKNLSGTKIILHQMGDHRLNVTELKSSLLTRISHR